MNGVRVGVYGSGRTAAALVDELRRSPHRITSSIVHSPHRAGQDLGELTIGAPIGVETTSDLEGTLHSGEIDVLLYAGLGGQRHTQAMEGCAASGVDMVHVCFANPEAAMDKVEYQLLDGRAKVSGARIVGTGLSSGFWFDSLPAFIASSVSAPASVSVRYVSDISFWTTSDLVAFIGLGTLTSGPSAEVGSLLENCASVIAAVLGLQRFQVESRGGVVAASRETHVGSVKVRRGEVVGFAQSIVLSGDSKDRVELSFSGFPDLAARGMEGGGEIIATGGNGSQLVMRATTPKDPYPGTAARMIRAVDVLEHLPPGLLPVTALPIG